METETKQYVEAIEKIVASGLPPRQAARRIANLRAKEFPPTMTYKEYSYAKGICIRTINRLIRDGKLKTIQVTPNRMGKRILV